MTSNAVIMTIKKLYITDYTHQRTLIVPIENIQRNTVVSYLKQQNIVKLTAAAGNKPL